MANPYRGESKVTLAGQEYTLRYNRSAIATLEKDVGMSIGFLMSEGNAQRYMGTHFLSVALYVGLKGHYRNISQRRVLDMMDHDPDEEQGWAKAVMLGILRAYGQKITDQEMEDLFASEDLEANPLPEQTSEQVQEGTPGS